MENNKPVITIMVGLPRSGKSTWVDKYKYNAVVISADDLRLLIYGQRYFSGGEQYMWAVRDTMLKYLINQGKDIIIDDTNTMISRRSLIIKLAKSAGYYIKAIVVATDLEECIRRATVTEQADLEPAIYRMNKQYQPPTEEEGFDLIEVI
jgi:predicted kinase